MPYYHFFEITDLLLILLAFVSGWRKVKMRDTAERIFCILLAITFIEEGIAYYCSVRFRQNIPVLRIYSLVEIFMTSLYFNYSIPLFRKWKIGIYIGSFAFLVGLIDCLLSTDLKQFSKFFMFVEGTVIISMALFSLFQQAKNYTYQLITRTAQFWIAVILILFWCPIILNLTFYDTLAKTVPGYQLWCGYFFFGVNYLYYLAAALIFSIYPKIKNL